MAATIKGRAVFYENRVERSELSPASSIGESAGRGGVCAIKVIT